MDDDFEIERTLVQLPSVHVMRIPPRSSADGYRAADWPQEPIWTGRIKITAKGKLATITLHDEKKGVFAQCPVSDDNAVERTVDSGRYFVLRIQNAQGKHAYIGIAFNERNDAFEFNVALQEFKAQNDREKESEAGGSGVAVATSNFRDLGNNNGEKIKINLARKTPSDGAPKAKPTSNLFSNNTGGGLLAPPPKSGGGLLAPPSSKSNNGGGLLAMTPPTAVAASGGFSDPFGAPATSSGGFSDPFGGGSTSAPTTSSSGESTDPFGAGDPFASVPANVFSGATQNASNNSNSGSLLDF